MVNMRKCKNKGLSVLSLIVVEHQTQTSVKKKSSSMNSTLIPQSTHRYIIGLLLNPTLIKYRKHQKLIELLTIYLSRIRTQTIVHSYHRSLSLGLPLLLMINSIKFFRRPSGIAVKQQKWQLFQNTKVQKIYKCLNFLNKIRFR